MHQPGPATASCSGVSRRDSLRLFRFWRESAAQPCAAGQGSGGLHVSDSELHTHAEFTMFIIQRLSVNQWRSFERGCWSACEPMTGEGFILLLA